MAWSLECKWSHVVYTQLLTPTNKVSTDNDETVSAMAKLAKKIDESASVVVGDGMVSQMMFSRDKLWRAMLSCSSRPSGCEGWLHGRAMEQKAPRSVSWSAMIR